MWLLVVLDGVVDPHNVAATLRTIEALGVQHAWLVSPPLPRRDATRARRDVAKVAKGADQWLTVRSFETPEACLEALRADGWGDAIWVAADGEGAVPLVRRTIDVMDDPAHIIPPVNGRVALVIGREADGVSPVLAAAAHKRVYVPLRGFTASLNLSVAAALLVQRLVDEFPQLWLRQATESDKEAIRAAWRPFLARTKAAERKIDAWTAASSGRRDGPVQSGSNPALSSTSSAENHNPPTSSHASISSGSWVSTTLRRREAEAAARRSAAEGLEAAACPPQHGDR